MNIILHVSHQILNSCQWKSYQLLQKPKVFTIRGPLVPYVVYTCQRGAYQKMDRIAMEGNLNGFTTSTRTQESLQAFNFYLWMMRLYYVRSRRISSTHR